MSSSNHPDEFFHDFDPPFYRKFIIIYYDNEAEKLQYHFDLAPDMLCALENFRDWSRGLYEIAPDVLNCYTTDL